MCLFNFLKKCSGMSIFEGLQLDIKLKHLEENEAEEDQKCKNKEVL